MINIEKIKTIIAPLVTSKNLIIINLEVNQGNRIILYLDSIEGVTIDTCAEISRTIEKELDRDIEDYHLEVSSAGLDHPLQIPFQYKKNVGRKVDVLTTNNERIKGELTKADNESITITYQKREKVAGKKKKQNITRHTELAFEQIRQTKIIPEF